MKTKLKLTDVSKAGTRFVRGAHVSSGMPYAVVTVISPFEVAFLRKSLRNALVVEWVVAVRLGLVRRA